MTSMKTMRMNKLLCAVTIFATHLSIAQTEIQRSLPCDETSRLLAQLSVQYKETPAWIGKLENESKYAMFTNTQTKSWTFIQVTPRLSCVLAVGDNFQQIDQKSTKPLQGYRQP